MMTKEPRAVIMARKRIEKEMKKKNVKKETKKGRLQLRVSHR